MNWFYANDGQQTGPVTDLQLEELLNSGKITPDTLVWREGMTDWLPLTAARSSLPPTLPASESATCAECGRIFPLGDLIQLNRVWVCAGCKPVFLQKLSEGVAPTKAPGNLWRMNKQLVTVSETPLPDRCVKCNAPVQGFRLKRVLYWQHPAYYLLLFCNLLVLIVVVLIVRKKAILHIGLCEKHRAQRKQIILFSWLSGLAGLALVGMGVVASKSVWLILLGSLMLLAAVIYGGLKAPMISAAKITDENVWVKGVHRDFLADLPEWPGV